MQFLYFDHGCFLNLELNNNILKSVNCHFEDHSYWAFKN
jgi:hypothetical protein